MASYQGIMLDLETLGTKPGCVVLQIGAVEFNEKGIVGEHYVSIDPESCAQWGLTIEPRTVMWWMDQSQDARDFITKGRHSELDVALAGFISAFKWKGKQVWANGAGFDFQILKAAFNAVGHDAPWQFWDECDYRTIKNLIGRDVFDKLRVEPSVAHNALADATAQAETLIAMLDHLNGGTRVKRKAT